MSRSRNSASRSQSRSRSRTRSRSRSHSTSRSRSHSRSRSRKHRYSSRSRSRSRSHSPFYNRDKKYPKGYQNPREFRGFHRGFRRPYNSRGRGRGYFPRGRYQRGGGGYNNNNHFRNNWKNYKQNPQKQQQHQQQQQHLQQNHWRGRSYLQKRSGSPPPTHSHRSDRSSSPLSRQSQQSSASSHSSSPKCRPALSLANQSSKDVKEELPASAEAQKGGEGDGEQPEVTEVQVEDAKESQGGGKAEGSWRHLTECSGSPKRASPPASATASQSCQTNNQPSLEKLNESSSALPRPGTCRSPSAKKPSQEALNSVLSSFDFLAGDKYLDGDKTAISIAFRKFLEEQTKKAKSANSGKKAETAGTDVEQEGVNGKASTGVSDSRGCREDVDGEVSLTSLLRTSPFLSADGEEEDELLSKPHSQSLLKDWPDGDESSKPKAKVAHSARELFDECFGKWQNGTVPQLSNSHLVAMAEEIYSAQNQDRAAAIAAALAKRELLGHFEELSKERGCNARKVAKSPSDPSPPPPRRNPERETFTIRGGESALLSSRKQESKFNVRMDILGDSLMSSSDILAEERQLSQDLVQSAKKDQEFRSIFQHVQATPAQKTPSELFAQHIVSIVHQTKAQHFGSSGVTLNERFTMYQRRAAEMEVMKQRKSPEIHRRIDVSPSAFKKHSQLFEAMKSSEDGTYKDAGEKPKGDPMDLRLDIERRKKYPSNERDFSQNRGRSMEESAEFSREKSAGKSSKHSKKSKKKKSKRSRSSSSSSSSSSKSQKADLSDEMSDCKDDGPKPGQMESPAERGRASGGFQVRIRGKGWSRGSQGNSSQFNPLDMAVQTRHEDWDPEYTPKSKKYYLHDDRDGEAEGNWAESRGRGRGSFARGRARFIIRKANLGSSVTYAKWAHNKFKVNGGPGVGEETHQVHKVGETNGKDT